LSGGANSALPDFWESKGRGKGTGRGKGKGRKVGGGKEGKWKEGKGKMTKGKERQGRRKGEGGGILCSCDFSLGKPLILLATPRRSNKAIVDIRVRPGSVLLSGESVQFGSISVL